MGKLNEYDAIAFDLDGTLIDSAPDIAFALGTALREAGLRSFSLADVRRWIGDGPDVLIGHALVAQGMGDASAELRSQLRAGFDVATLQAPLARGAVFDGIDHVVTQLARVMPLVVVTNKPTVLAQAVLAAARLLPHVCAVFGADAPEHRKPAPHLLLAAARRLGMAPARLLMVGDGPADVRAARAAGCGAALVEWGYAHAAVQDDGLAPPPWRVRTPHQLLGCALLDACATTNF